MKIKFCAYLAFLLLSESFCVWSQDRKSRDGDKSYAPTRLEWVAVTMNAELHVAISKTSDYQISFIPLAGTDTILIYVTYLPSANREAMNMMIDAARKVIEIDSKAHGWSSWLKVKERIELAKE